MKITGKCSWFGGPNDTGVTPSEGLAFIYTVDMAPDLFLPQQPPGTTGLARRLDPNEYYIACRWDYSVTSKNELLDMMTLVRSPKTGKQFMARPADWGPHGDTSRVADISPGLMEALGISTDDEVEVYFPYEEGVPVMPYQSIVISAGHSSKCRGAIGIIDEYTENVRVMEKTADILRNRGVTVRTFADTISTTQNENLNRIVDYHNSQERELDVSIHFNANVETNSPMGTECLYVTQGGLADAMADSIAGVGFKDRGPKKRTDLFFLNNTEEPAILIEVCFVDSAADVELYKAEFDKVCDAIAIVLGGEGAQPVPPEPGPEVATVTVTIDAPPGVNVVIHQTVT